MRGLTNASYSDFGIVVVLRSEGGEETDEELCCSQRRDISLLALQSTSRDKVLSHAIRCKRVTVFISYLRLVRVFHV